MSRSYDKRFIAALAIAVSGLAVGAGAHAAGVQLWAPGGVPVVSTLDDRSYPMAVPDGAGGAFVVWFEGGAVRLQRLTPAGSVAPGWSTSAGLMVCNETIHGGWMQSNPRAIPDGQGGLFVLWCDQRLQPCEVSCLGDPGQLFVQRVTSSGAIAAGWPPLGADVGSALGKMNPQPYGSPGYPSEMNPVMVADGLGGVLVAWTEGTTPYFPTTPIPGLHVQRLSGAGERLWGDHGLVACAPPSGAPCYPAIAPAGAGGAIVAWEDDRDATDGSRIYFQQISSVGQPLLDANGRRLSAIADVQERCPQLVALANGGAVAVWEAGVSNQGHDLFGARVGPGAQAVTAKGSAIAVETPIVTSALPGGELSLIASASSGAWLSWTDVRNPGYQAMYVQRLRDDGGAMPGWPAGGLATCGPTATRCASPMLVEDVLGGVYVGWRDDNGPTVARFVRGARARGWPSNGVVLSTTGYDVGFHMIPDAAHGAIPVWDEWMSYAGVDDIRAQRIAPFDAVPYVLPVGDPLVAPQPPPGGLNELKAQLEVKPNPAHGALRIEFALSRSEPATLDVFDLVGRRVAHRELAASSGARSITLDEGASLAPGLYLVKLTQGDLQIARRAIVAR